MRHRFSSFSLFTLLLLVMIVGSASAQTGPRVVASQNIARNQNAPITTSTIPSTGSYADIRTSNTVSDVIDPVHPCRIHGAGSGGYSVFLRVFHPGGILNVNTVDSNYDTVLSVFNAVGGRAAGAALLCNDDASESTSVVSGSLVGGEYIIMISRWSTAASGGALNLEVDLSFTSVNTPANDSHTAPVTLTVGATTLQTRPHLLTDNATDLGLIANCAMYNTAWYSFTAPESGYYRFDTYGTNIVVQPNYSTTASSIAVHSNTLSVQFTCAVDSTASAATDSLYLSAETTYLVRAGSSYNVNMLPGTVYSIRPIFVSGNLIRNNINFSAGGTGWTTVGWDGGDSFSASTALMNAGAATKSLMQARNNPPSYFKLSPKGTVYLQARYTYTGTATGTIRLRINYNDGTPQTIINMQIVSGFTQTILVPVKLASRNVRKVRVYAILNPGSGQLSLDYLFAEYERGVFAAMRQDAGLLTMPDALGQ